MASRGDLLQVASPSTPSGKRRPRRGQRQTHNQHPAATLHPKPRHKTGGKSPERQLGASGADPERDDRGSAPFSSIPSSVSTARRTSLGRRLVSASGFSRVWATEFAAGGWARWRAGLRFHLPVDWLAGARIPRGRLRPVSASGTSRLQWVAVRGMACRSAVAPRSCCPRCWRAAAPSGNAARAERHLARFASVAGPAATLRAGSLSLCRVPPSHARRQHGLTCSLVATCSRDTVFHGSYPPDGGCTGRAFWATFIRARGVLPQGLKVDAWTPPPEPHCAAMSGDSDRATRGLTRNDHDALHSPTGQRQDPVETATWTDAASRTGRSARSCSHVERNSGCVRSTSGESHQR